MGFVNATRLGGGATFSDIHSFETFQRTLVGIVLFCFLWIYHLHIAIFQMTIAGAVSHWYFHRNDLKNSANTARYHWNERSGRFVAGKPILYAFCRVMRYHLGSCALGSFILAVVGLLRSMLEYLDKQTKKQQEANAVIKALACSARCCLWCFHKCLKFLTTYAYINIAVTGRNFCGGAHACFVLMAKYPVQIALDALVSSALGWIASLMVPSVMITVAWFYLEKWSVCSFCIALAAFMVTRLAVSVYDVSLSTLFVCAMRDAEMYEGRYASEELRTAMQMPEKLLPRTNSRRWNSWVVDEVECS